jgi:hypothetical protein
MLDMFGAARGTRTPDPVITNDVLYQLSYCGGPFWRQGLKGLGDVLLISGVARIGKDDAGATTKA